MNMNKINQSKHRKWRSEVKKLRRKRIRQARAKERDKKLEEEEEARKKDPEYQNWLKQQEEFDRMTEEEELRRHDDEEEKWLRRELLAQKAFAEQKKRQAASEKAKEEERLRILKEFEEQQLQAKKRIEEKKRLVEENKRRQEELQLKIEAYIAGECELPEELLQRADSNPGKPDCHFFLKTASCRFGDKCSRNHSKPGISRMLLLRNFFSHIRLEQAKNTEYGSDLVLEYSDSELYKDYRSFFNDVIPELKKFGRIENFKTCKNCEPHLRGNVIVEYDSERNALKALRNLQGRYYAGKQINLEFCSLQTWKSAVCGLSLSGKCPKGRNCNFLHVFDNPGSQYPLRTGGSSRRTQRTHERRIDSWDDHEDISSRKRDWRWSESPERGNHRERNGRQERSQRSSSQRYADDSSERRRRSHSKKSETLSERRRRHRSRSRSNDSQSCSRSSATRSSYKKLSREFDKTPNKKKERSSRSKSTSRKRSKHDKKKRKRKKSKHKKRCSKSKEK